MANEDIPVVVDGKLIGWNVFRDAEYRDFEAGGFLTRIKIRGPSYVFIPVDDPTLTLPKENHASTDLDIDRPGYS